MGESLAGFIFPFVQVSGKVNKSVEFVVFGWLFKNSFVAFFTLLNNFSSDT